MKEVMLRFGARAPALEDKFREAGEEVIIPQRRRDRGHAPDFFVVVSEDAAWKEQVQRAGEFLRMYEDDLREYGAESRGTAELHFGIDVEEVGDLANCWFPHELLVLLGRLPLTLNVSVYA